MSTAGEQLRSLIWMLMVAPAALALWSCSGGGSSSPDGSNSGEQAQVKASCDAIRDIESYRYTIALKLESPAIEQDAQATPSPLSEFTEALTNLFRDMELEGAFVAPDRSQTLLRFPGQELELRTIDDKSWIRFGATWQEQESPPGEGGVLTPAAVCSDLVKDLTPSLSATSGEIDTVTGIETVHYRLDKADLQGLPSLLGSSGEEGLPNEFNVDVWLERDAGWPVRLEVATEDTGEEGKPLGLQFSMEFSEINDPSIEINPPPVSPADT